MDIERNGDGTLPVPVVPERPDPTGEGGGEPTAGSAADVTRPDPRPTTRLLHPGEDGYDEASAGRDRQQDSGR